MALPFEIKRLFPGRLKISSFIFQKLRYKDEVVESFFYRFPGVKKVKFKKENNTLILEYDLNRFDMIEFFNYLKLTNYELFLEDLSRVSPSSQVYEKKPSSWFKLNFLLFIPQVLTGFTSNYLSLTCSVLASLPVFKKGFRSLSQKRLDVHFLDSLALFFSFLSKQYFSAYMMGVLLSLGDYLEDRLEKKSLAKLQKFFENKDDKVWLLKEEGKIEKKSLQEIRPQDRIVIYSGEKIPVDGKVLKGEALVNQSNLTGESMPVHKKVEDKVYAGTFVVDGKLYVEVEKIGKDTVVGQIIRIIEEGMKVPLKIQEKVEAYANKMVYPILLGAGYSFLNTRSFQNLASVLTIDFHTGIAFPTPLAVMNGVLKLSERGIFVRSGAKLEKLAETRVFIFDKTGTLTLGEPCISDIWSLEKEEIEILKIAASLEQRINHPVAKAILNLAKEKGLELFPRLNSNYHLGMGIEAEINGDRYLLGSTKFMLKKRIKISKEVREKVDLFHQEGKSVLYLVQNGRIIGLLTFFDPPKEEAKWIIEKLKSRGCTTILCTGDNEGVARYMAQKLNMDKYFARVLPQEKAEIVKDYKSMGETVTFMGDGVNDAPALSVADVGIAVSKGAELTVEVADIVLGENLTHLILIYDLSKALKQRIEKIYQYNFKVNTIGLIGAIMGITNPVISTFINNGTSIILGLYALKSF
ncbi:MAG: heavy metal translocating P-type ATPase [Thermodesulfobacteriaceae bacterium]|nr:heavy metal translocating P-type ATPase [Thermodesulfobacteriaceae bacterium]MDW8136734.1 heavy metal translocating P-type ATPase [Thermodesulfobacterium sp.]